MTMSRVRPESAYLPEPDLVERAGAGEQNGVDDGMQHGSYGGTGQR